MKRVVKYNLYPGTNDFDDVDKLLSIGFQENQLVGWFEEKRDASTTVYIYVTGYDQIPDEQQFVATAQLSTNGYQYVVHAYQ